MNFYYNVGTQSIGTYDLKILTMKMGPVTELE
jgi:hypothetical protein